MKTIELNTDFNALPNFMELTGLVANTIQKFGFRNHGVLSAMLRKIGCPVDAEEHKKLQSEIDILELKLRRHYLKAISKGTRFATCEMAKEL